MNSKIIKCSLIIFVVCLLAFVYFKASAEETYPSSPPLLTNQELDDVLAPIALYPDPLLAQILPASTYTDEIIDAYNWLNSGGSTAEIDGQRWDESVKAVARYPDVLKMMADNGDWTADLGDAFLNQPEDVTKSIQNLRWQARNNGNLESNSSQNVVIVGDYIEIIPAQPQYIYVPSYDPSNVYEESSYAGGEPFVTFGVGLMMGGWLTMDFDWGNHHVIYHGWNRPGWVNHARPYVHVNNVYVNNSKPYINNNWRHDVSHGNPDRFRTAHPGIAQGAVMRSRETEIRGRSVTAVPSKTYSPSPTGYTRSFDNRGKESGVGGVSKQTIPAQDVKKQPSMTIPGVRQRPASRTPEVVQRPEVQTSGMGNVNIQTRSAGEALQRTRTPSVTFGGYRGAMEARGQSLRGQTSRQSSEKVQTSSAPSATRGSAGNNGGSRGNARSGKGDERAKSRR